MKLNYAKHPNLQDSIANLIKPKISEILKELNSLDHLDDFVKIITIFLSNKFEGNESKMRAEFMDIFENRDDLTDNFISWLKVEIPKFLKEKNIVLNEPKKEQTEKKDSGKGIMDRVKFPEKSKKENEEKPKKKRESRRNNQSGGKYKSKRNYEDFEEGLSESDDYDNRSR